MDYCQDNFFEFQEGDYQGPLNNMEEFQNEIMFSQNNMLQEILQCTHIENMA